LTITAFQFKLSERQKRSNSLEAMSFIRQRRQLSILTCLTAFLLLYTGCKHNAVESKTENLKPVAAVGKAIQISSAHLNAAEPAVASAPDGSVYVAWVNHGPKRQADVMLARFKTDGQMITAPVRVNPQPGTATAWRGDPPTIAIAPDKTLFVGWTARVEADSGHATEIYVSASRDQGQSFEAPVRVNDDLKPGDHGMHSLAIGNDGRIYVAWLDERNVVAVPASDPKMKANTGGHHKESNRELFLSFSADSGRSFSPNKSIAKDVCPCCKTSLAMAPDNRLYLSWRQVLPGDFRHIAISSSADGGKVFSPAVIVSDDQWMLQGCPVSSAALSAGADGYVRVLWYAGSENSKQGIYWSESKDAGKSFTPRQLVAAGFARSSPLLISDAQKRFLAIWEASANGLSELHASGIEREGSALSLSIVENGELPAAVSLGNQVFVAYVVKEGEKRSVWAKPIWLSDSN
jgi:hypothetical protein